MYRSFNTRAKRGMQHSIMYGRLLNNVLIKSPIFVPCSPIFSFARASIQRSKGVVDFASSKTTNGRSPTGPYFCWPDSAVGDAFGGGVGDELSLGVGVVVAEDFGFVR